MSTFVFQCIPTALAWFFHHLPQWFLKLSCVATYLIEIPIPLLFFSPVKSMRMFAFYSQVCIIRIIKIPNKDSYSGTYICWKFQVIKLVWPCVYIVCIICYAHILNTMIQSFLVYFLVHCIEIWSMIQMIHYLRQNGLPKHYPGVNQKSLFYKAWKYILGSWNCEMYRPFNS